MMLLGGDGTVFFKHSASERASILHGWACAYVHIGRGQGIQWVMGKKGAYECGMKRPPGAIGEEQKGNVIKTYNVCVL